MCGIIGYIGKHGATPLLLEGLKRMEYRGYDSAGVAVMNGNGVETRKARVTLPSRFRMSRNARE